MTTAPPPNHDPALAHVGGSGPQQPQAGANGAQPAAGMSGELQQGVPMGSEQVIALLKTLGPSGFPQRDSAAAEALSNLAAQATYQGHPGHIPHPHQPPPHQYAMHAAHQHAHVLPNEPGPSTHPRGPPDLGQLAQTAALQNGPQSSSQGPTMRTRSQDAADQQQQPQGQGENAGPGSTSGAGPAPDGASTQSSGEEKVGAVKSAGGRRGGRSATMTNDEWTRQRKDNHKEVERRRRGNINEGINELGRIVPNGSGEKAKGAILSRAVQYIHHLKENESRNIEKWTLEKLLMDQAMGDLQAQLEETRRAWDEERLARQRAESELDVLRGLQQGLPLSAAAAAAAAAVAAHAPPTVPGLSKPSEQQGAKSPEASKEVAKRDREGEKDGATSSEQAGSDPKRPRVE
ncbi:hypothetical protein WOLCODRAFT_138239 [Wolfiporia cocos MD-104 SS10]|uniref:BHLH domain-containing protein n=1 Tax=Wolfiporia cocos (strain MD-104) TaxID=742152 RepID=A0A2H3JTB6_WOLCO|nr:hypothetical protein WOLCODRAFT_138239 [Wolfiporia cocos MD-104 SS10]